MNVKDVMTTPVDTVGPEATWKEVAERMLDCRVSGLPVVDGDGYLLGVVTEADLLSKPAFGDQQHRSLAAVIDLMTGAARWAGKARALTAAQLMSTAVITAAPYESIKVAAQRMLDYEVKRLPVLDGGQLVGIVSRTDIVRSILHRSAVKAGFLDAT
jgi:CBS domain-containing protein